VSRRGPRDLEAKFGFLAPSAHAERLIAERRRRADELAAALRGVSDEQAMLDLTAGAQIGTLRLQRLRAAWRDGTLDEWDSSPG